MERELFDMNGWRPLDGQSLWRPQYELNPPTLTLEGHRFELVPKESGKVRQSYLRRQHGEAGERNA